MGIVLVRTYKHSGYPYIYTCAAMMFASTLCQLITEIILNWAVFCPEFYSVNEKCHGEPTTNWNANLRLINIIFYAL